MSAHRAQRRVASAAFLLLLTIATAYGQIGIQGRAILMHATKAGKTIKGRITVVNQGSTLAAFRIFLLPSKDKRDVCEWLKLSEEYVNVQAGSAVKIGYKLKTQKKWTGSYFARYAVQPIKRESVGMLTIKVLYRGTVICTCPGGHSEIIFSATDYTDGMLTAKLRNVGTVSHRPNLVFYAGEGMYKAERRLLLPGEEKTFSVRALNISGRVTAFAHDGESGWGTMWKIEDGAEFIKEITTIIPVRLRLQSDIGERGRNRLLASAHTQLGRFNIGTSAFMTQRGNRFNLNLGYRRRSWSAYTYMYMRDGRLRFNVSSMLNLNRWHLMVSAQPMAESGQFNLRYKFTNGGYCGLRASLIRDNIHWNLTASLPFTINLKFRKKIKEADIKTFKVGRQ